MVGRLNLLPRARVAARSLAGPDPALRIAGLASADVEISKAGKYGASLAHELLDELEARSARWGLISAADSVLLIERIEAGTPQLTPEYFRDRLRLKL